MNIKVCTTLLIILWAVTACSQSFPSAITDKFKVILMADCVSKTCVEYNEIDVRVLNMYSNYAWVSVVNKKDPEDPIFAFFKKDKGRWVLLDEGSGVNTTELGIPNELFKK